MEFCEFVQKLYPYCGNGCTPGEFVIRILKNITTEQENSIFDKSNDYLRKIYNGTKNITKTSASYLLTHLDLETFDSYIFNTPTDDSLIKLCGEFESIVGNADKESISIKLGELLTNILQEIANPKVNNKNFSTDTINMEDELSNIIKNLSNLSSKEIEGILKYEPYNVDKKILSKNQILKKDIRTNVIDYYTFIEKQFQQECQNRTSSFDILASLIKEKSDNLISEGLPQEVVVDKLVHWVQDKGLTSNKTACRIIVAFFVQNCEVFHEITK